MRVDVNMKRPFTLKEEYPITYNGEYYCTCYSFEQAHYVHQELTKYDYNREELQGILDSYPKYYVYLLNFYKYIGWDTQKDTGWFLHIPPKFADNHIANHIRYKRVEDALFERDFLIKCDWDYNTLVECINDTKNTYYDMELPPFPTYRFHHRWGYKTHYEELETMMKIIRENPDIYSYELARELKVSTSTLYSWLRQYTITLSDFKTLVLTVDNPLDQLIFDKLTGSLEQEPRPELPENIIYVTKKDGVHYQIYRKKVFYGIYDSLDLAIKIRADLIKCNWDKNELNNIRKKHGVKVRDPSMKYISKSKYDRYVITKIVDNRRRQFGSFHTLEEAKKVRDALVENDWDFNAVHI